MTRKPPRLFERNSILARFQRSTEQFPGWGSDTAPSAGTNLVRHARAIARSRRHHARNTTLSVVHSSQPLGWGSGRSRRSRLRFSFEDMPVYKVCAFSDEVHGGNAGGSANKGVRLKPNPKANLVPNRRRLGKPFSLRTTPGWLWPSDCQ
jgi:hypothetical protein